MSRTSEQKFSALLMDLYELTMAQGYWKSGLASRRACFHVAFRTAPFGGQYAIAAGLNGAVQFLETLHFGEDDLAYLASLKSEKGSPLFDRGFLEYLKELEPALDVDAMPEGTLVFGNEPMLRVTGPLLAAQIVETALLNFLNFQTLIATKSARICQAAHGQGVIEFGLRRAQGVNGGLSASRAAYIGGCSATSNLQAGKIFGIPVKGTHAHSWIMSFDSELEAFRAYAAAMPDDCLFLVDTYDTLQGVRNAITVARGMRQAGHEMIGIRLDSGDLAYLSIEARKLLDDAGFADAKILASNDLDEHLISDLRQQGAKIDFWGVGTRLVTSFDQPALGGVYKLTALQDRAGQWQHRIKLSEQTAKVSIPGILQVRRFSDGHFAADAIYDTLLGIDDDNVTIVDPSDMTRRKIVKSAEPHEDLLVPIFRAGRRVYDPPGLDQIRRRAADQLARLHPTIRRFTNPHRYPAGLEQKLFDLRTQLILQARNLHPTEPAKKAR